MDVGRHDRTSNTRQLETIDTVYTMAERAELIAPLTNVRTLVSGAIVIIGTRGG